MTVVALTRQNVVDFLYKEAKLLDEWKLKEWAALFTDDGTYKVPPIGKPEASPTESLFYVHDNRSRLQERAERLLKKEAHVEYPHSTTLRNYHNILVSGVESDVITVECNFTTHRTKREVLDTFVGKHKYEIVQQNGELAIKSKKVILHLDSLRPHGKISLIL
ncbi:toluate 1,2-dioxygenase subunit beta [Thalassobacillus devorans]|uniref:Toluate 1,2-dioxygenase subunit beta n=1 Tax=Thalassobacillus devorans TaxID=279813 RepID=A0ABQ1PJ18_9BACI|nr:aromatic-ring-hydroxylating dioxygenase subunit beta [Thalassobacillus devorans]NIK30054.1 p-cumate 2,3-dioxygenase beta subunit [Thalassobacillus devorans]GGC97974.1 toluate 1,2-dioxygenase subunit beta [Thalassobacillus devorans]